MTGQYGQHYGAGGIGRSRRSEDYFVQYQETNPLGRPMGWRTIWHGKNDADAAKDAAKAYRTQHRGVKVRIIHRPGVEYY